MIEDTFLDVCLSVQSCLCKFQLYCRLVGVLWPDRYTMCTSKAKLARILSLCFGLQALLFWPCSLAFRLRPLCFSFFGFSLQLSGFILQNSGFGLWDSCFGVRDLAFGLWSSVFGLQALVFASGFGILAEVFWCLDFGLRTVVFGLRSSDFGHRTLVFRLWYSGFMLQTSLRYGL